jgi:hypothetical protein
LYRNLPYNINTTYPREKEQYHWEGMRAAGRAARMAFCQMGIYLFINYSLNGET